MSTESDTTCVLGADNEVWSFGDEAYEICKAYLNLRGSMKPYIIRQMAATHEQGIPVVRLLSYDFPKDKMAWEIKDQYIFGPDMIVAPVLYTNMRKRTVYFPEGREWEHFFTGGMYRGGTTAQVEAPIGQLPVLAATQEGKHRLRRWESRSEGKMRFTGGYQHIREEIDPVCAVEYYDAGCSTNYGIACNTGKKDNSPVVYVATKHMGGRGDTLNQPILTATFSSPMENVIRVSAVYPKGALYKGPHYQVTKQERSFVSITEDKETIAYQSGRTSAVIYKAPMRWRVGFKDGDRLLTKNSF